MKTAIYIFGAGGMGRETYCLINDLPQYEVIAFVEQDNADISSINVTVAGKIVEIITESQFAEICSQNKDISAVIGIGIPQVRRKIAEKFSIFCNFPNIIHPSATLAGAVQSGHGNLVMHNCVFTENIELCNFNLFNISAIITHDCKIGNYNVFLPSCNVSGSVTVGDSNLIGSNAFIIEKTTIGANNIIGAGSVVLKNIGNSTTWVGNPAKRIK